MEYTDHHVEVPIHKQVRTQGLGSLPGALLGYSSPDNLAHSQARLSLLSARELQNMQLAFKLLGVPRSNTLCWARHVWTLCRVICAVLGMPHGRVRSYTFSFSAPFGRGHVDFGYVSPEP